MIKQYYDQLCEIDSLLQFPCFLIIILSVLGGVFALANCQFLLAITGFIIAATCIMPLEVSRRLSLMLDEAEYRKRIYPDELLDLENYIILSREDHQELIKRANKSGSGQLNLYREKLDDLVIFMFFSLVLTILVAISLIIYADIIGEEWVPVLNLLVIVIFVLINFVAFARLTVISSD